MDIYSLRIREITKKNLLYCRENSAHLSLVLNGKEIQMRGDICIHTADSLRCTAETILQ